MDLLTLAQMEDEAQQDANKHDQKFLLLVGVARPLVCRWGDASMGIFLAEGVSGFLMTKDFHPHQVQGNWMPKEQHDN